jgi:hypothetical protein
MLAGSRTTVLSQTWVGGDDYVSTTYTDSPTTELTAFAWVAVDSARPQNSGVIAKYVGSGESNRSWALAIDTSRKPIGDFSSDGSYQAANALVAPSALTAGQWYLLAITYSAPNGSVLYIDGNVVDTNTTAPASLHASSKPTLLGLQYGEEGDANWTDMTLDGRIALAGVYTRTLTHSEIQQLYDDPLAPLQPSNQFILTTVVTAGEGIDIPASISEAAQSGYLTSSIIAIVGQLTEAATSSDTISPTMLLSPNVIEGAESTDTLTSSMTSPQFVSEGAQSADTIASLANYSGLITEGAISSDDPAAQLIATALVEEDAESGDSLLTTAIYPVSITENVESDSVYIGSTGLLVTVVEGANSTDGWSRTATIPVVLSDGATSSDSITTTTMYAVSLVEASISDDNITTTAILTATIADSAIASDILSYTSSILATIDEGALSGDRYIVISADFAPIIAATFILPERIDTFVLPRRLI